MKKKICIICTSLFVFSGCSFGENPDKENFEVQHQEPSMQEEESKLFEQHNQ